MLNSLRLSRVCGTRGLASMPLNYRVTVPETARPGPPLVLLHGLFGSSSNFGTIARKCASILGVPVILPDLRNHGTSPWSDDMSFDSMAADLLAVLDAEGCERAVLCGHSLGGKVQPG